MRIYDNFDLTNFNSYKIKSICQRAIFFDHEDEILEYYKHNSSRSIKILGAGNNVIFSKRFYEEDFLIFSGNFNFIEKMDSGVLVAESGATMLDLSLMAMRNHLSGLEFFYDIPSSLGGAIVMNAGAGGEEIKDLLVKVRYLDLDDLMIKEIVREEMNFEYRNSFFQTKSNKIILKGWLQLQTKLESISILKKMEDIKNIRWSKQPRNYPNAGSVFKRPPGCYVGPMIEQLGLKGMVLGGAMVSEKHGGFILNYNNATGQDVINLIMFIKEKVKNRFNIELDIEQQIV